MSQILSGACLHRDFQKGVDVRCDQIWGRQMKRHLLAIDGDGARAGNQPRVWTSRGAF